MKYAVTYCALDHEFSGNPFWHSCILLSQWDEPGHKIKVVDNWGFYGVPTTTRNSWLGRLKISLGLDIDLSGNHGMLKHEELRFLDVGSGLHGVTFELSEELFVVLQQRCLNMVQEQNEAISEIVESQHIAGKPPEKTRIYPHEDLSYHIYTLEKMKAQQQSRPSRLKPFELNPSLTFWGPSLQGSHTCKSQIISLLDGIIDTRHIARITEYGSHPTIPRYSGKLERIYLHSSGPLRQHQRTSGQITHYRDLEDEDVELHWTLPPQEMIALSQETTKMLEISPDYYDEVKSAVSRLQKLEWLFINAKLPAQYDDYRTHLINSIRHHYEAFARIEEKEALPTIADWRSYALFLLSLPRDRDEQLLLHKIRHAKMLMNSLYMAMADDWRIEDDEPPTRENDYIGYKCPYESLAAYLTIEDKQALCSLIGRTYIQPLVENHDFGKAS